MPLAWIIRGPVYLHIIHLLLIGDMRRVDG